MTAAGFRTRKVKVEQSIGDKLKRTRVRRKISVAQAEEATKIRAKFLLALESDSWDQIPSEVYGRGYLEAYAEFLRLPVEQLMEQYERSRAMYRRQCAPVDLSPVKRAKEPRFVVTPRILFATFAVVIAVGLAGVVGYQVRRFTSAPFLELVTPAQARSVGVSQLEVFADSFTVTGRTSVGATVSVNGKVVPVLPDGSFVQSVAVQRGVNSIIVEAVNPAGNKSSETLTVTVR